MPYANSTTCVLPLVSLCSIAQFYFQYIWIFDLRKALWFGLQEWNESEKVHHVHVGANHEDSTFSGRSLFPGCRHGFITTWTTSQDFHRHGHLLVNSNSSFSIHKRAKCFALIIDHAWTSTESLLSPLTSATSELTHLTPKNNPTSAFNSPLAAIRFNHLRNLFSFCFSNQLPLFRA